MTKAAAQQAEQAGSKPTPGPGGAPAPEAAASKTKLAPVAEVGGPSGPEPTRFGDWERGGRCVDF
jgi:hypothetical protein